MEPKLKTYLDEFRGNFEKIDKRFESIDKKFENIDRQFTEVNGRFDSVHDQLVSIRSDMATKDELAEQIGTVMEISAKILDRVEHKHDVLEVRVSKLETKVAI